MFFEYSLLAVALYVLWSIKDNYFSPKNLPPGPFRLPFLGNSLTLIRGRNKPPFVLFRDLAKKYGPVIYIQMGTQPTVVINDFDTAKHVLNSDIWVDRPLNGLLAERSYGKSLGVIFASGKGWREMRRFSLRTLRDFGLGKQANMQSIIDSEVPLLLKKVEEETSPTDSILCLKHLFTMSVLRSLWSMVSCTERTPEDDLKLHELSLLVYKLSQATTVGRNIVQMYPALRHFIPGLTGMTIFRNCVKGLQEYFQEVLETRRKEGKWRDEGRDFIDMFIKMIDKHHASDPSTNHYTDEQFNITITDIFEAGTETSSNTLDFAIFFLVKNPRVQKKIHDEIDRVVGKSRPPSITDRPAMTYTEATLLEVQRLANTLPISVRSPTENCTLNGHFVERGTMGIVNLYAVHTDKDFWEDPFIFRPERFLDEQHQIMKERASRVIAFGGGKRICIGEQMARATMFTFLTGLLQSYTFEILPEQKDELDRHECGVNVKMNGNNFDGSSKKSPDPEMDFFEKYVHVGFSLTLNPYQVKVIKRN